MMQRDPTTVDWMKPVEPAFADRWNEAHNPQSIDAAYAQAGVPRVGDYDDPSRFVHPVSHWYDVDRRQRQADEHASELATFRKMNEVMPMPLLSPETQHKIYKMGTAFLPETPLDFLTLGRAGAGRLGLGFASNVDEAQAAGSSKRPARVSNDSKMGDVAAFDDYLKNVLKWK